MTLTLEIVKSCLPNALVVFFFPQIDDLAVIFTPCENGPQNQLTGLNIMGMRKSRGCDPYYIKKEFLTDIFHARLAKTASGQILLHIRPLEHPLTLTKRSNGTWRCMLHHGKQLLTIDQVVVKGVLVPLSLNFTIHAKYQASATAPLQTYEIPIEAPADFTKKLYDLSTSTE